MENNIKEQLFAHIQQEYGLLPAHPWQKRPNDVVFRHTDNLRPFAMVSSIPGKQLGLDEYDPVEVLEVKMPDVMLVDLFTRQKGFFRGQHASRGNWLAILLDGTAPFDEITRLVSDSFLATASKETKQDRRLPKEWIIPSNPKYYDIVGAFDKQKEIQWKQAKGIKVNDIVYMYVGLPYSAILYKCIVTETGIPWKYYEGKLKITQLMKIKLLKMYPPGKFTLPILGTEYGIVTVRGPRGIPKHLSDALNQ